MQMSYPIYVIISVIKRNINSFQFNSYIVLPGKILCKIPAFQTLGYILPFSFERKTVILATLYLILQGARDQYVN